jgi:hypothetical protein
MRHADVLRPLTAANHTTGLEREVTRLTPDCRNARADHARLHHDARDHLPLPLARDGTYEHPRNELLIFNRPNPSGPNATGHPCTSQARRAVSPARAVAVVTAGLVAAPDETRAPARASGSVSLAG